jgi:hypothetical protein
LARDGRRETLEGAGRPLADQYQAQGLDILGVHAQFNDGSVSVEAGLADMLIRMESGRFKVFKHLTDWFDEYRLYHRKDGRVHKEDSYERHALRDHDASLCEDGHSTQAALDPEIPRRMDVELEKGPPGDVDIDPYGAKRAARAANRERGSRPRAGSPPQFAHVCTFGRGNCNTEVPCP